MDQENSKEICTEVIKENQNSKQQQTLHISYQEPIDKQKENEQNYQQIDIVEINKDEHYVYERNPTDKQKRMQNHQKISNLLHTVMHKLTSEEDQQNEQEKQQPQNQ